MEKFAQILRHKVPCLRMRYLGLPLGARFKPKVTWDTSLEKVEQCLVGWKKIYLFKGGRLTLIKRMLSNFLLISCLFFLFMFPLLFVLRYFKETFCGVGSL